MVEPDGDPGLLDSLCCPTPNSTSDRLRNVSEFDEPGIAPIASEAVELSDGSVDASQDVETSSGQYDKISC